MFWLSTVLTCGAIPEKYLKKIEAIVNIVTLALKIKSENRNTMIY
jgi:pyruvate-formate lyase-activating enzyme